MTGNSQCMTGGTDIARRVMQNEILHIDQFAVEPQRGAGIGKIETFDQSLADRGVSKTLVEPRQSFADARQRR